MLVKNDMRKNSQVGEEELQNEEDMGVRVYLTLGNFQFSHMLNKGNVSTSCMKRTKDSICNMLSIVGFIYMGLII